jgi:hypothetical protein
MLTRKSAPTKCAHSLGDVGQAFDDQTANAAIAADVPVRQLPSLC